MVCHDRSVGVVLLSSTKGATIRTELSKASIAREQPVKQDPFHVSAIYVGRHALSSRATLLHSERIENAHVIPMLSAQPPRSFCNASKTGADAIVGSRSESS